MTMRLSHTQLLRYSGLFTWAMVGIPLALNTWYFPADDQGGQPPDMLYSMLAFLAFGACYWLATRELGVRQPRWYDIVLLVMLSGAAILVSYLTGTGLGGILLMIVAGVIPWLMPLRWGIPWLVIQHVALVPVFVRLNFKFDEAVLQAALYIGYSSFTFITGLVAKQQAQAREEQRRLNSELRATRALLAESSRLSERLRISRELHDLLGHHLTALSLNLEVAGHLSEGRVKEHVQQAHTLARLLLTDVREAVSQLREGGAIDLAVALRPLAENVPSMHIHMDIESPLTMDDPERAHVLLRCAQEIITNAVRHAGARNLWIAASRTADCITMSARDDGRGTDQLVAGNGLRGMRERLRQHGGDLKIETRPEAGFSLQLTLPASASIAVCEGVTA
jgi:signal transduction histidine kinase